MHLVNIEVITEEEFKKLISLAKVDPKANAILKEIRKILYTKP